MDITSIKERIIEAVATAALLGGGGLIVTGAISDGQQDTRIERLERLDEKLDEMSRDLHATKEGVIRLEAKLENSNEQSD